MRTKKQILIAKIFNNFIGRKYLGVPKGKEVYIVSKGAVHYYTGDKSLQNGKPVICCVARINNNQ